jgi:hypothetical protein
VSLKIGEGLRNQSLTTLGECGAGRNECVVLWVANATDPAQVQRVVHPLHTAHGGGYRIDGDWLNHFWDELADNDERVVAQVHAHPHAAFHSRRDDEFPILLRPGLYSLVVPNFAREPIDSSNWYLAQLREDGSWAPLDWDEEAEA